MKCFKGLKGGSRCQSSCRLGHLNDNLFGGHALLEDVESILNPLQSSLKDHWVRLGLELSCCQSLGYILPPDGVTNVKINEAWVKTVD